MKPLDSIKLPENRRNKTDKGTKGKHNTTLWSIQSLSTEGKGKSICPQLQGKWVSQPLSVCLKSFQRILRKTERRERRKDGGGAERRKRKERMGEIPEKSSSPKRRDLH